MSLGANVLLTSSPQASSSSATATNQNSPGKYSELLAVIEELGKDIRPTYAGSKNAAERLKKGEIENTQAASQAVGTGAEISFCCLDCLSNVFLNKEKHGQFPQDEIVSLSKDTNITIVISFESFLI